MARPRERPEMTPEIRALLGEVRALGKQAARHQSAAHEVWQVRADLMRRLVDEAGFSENELARELALRASTVHEAVGKARARRSLGHPL